MINNLCVTYTGLTPFYLEERAYHDVIVLYSDVRKMQIREKKKKNQLIRRPASDSAGWW